jgi:hypothetical protein
MKLENKITPKRKRMRGRALKDQHKTMQQEEKVILYLSTKLFL